MYLLVELDVLQNFDGLVVIPQQGVQPQQADQAEVAQHLIQRVTAVFSGDALRVSWNAPTHRSLNCVVIVRLHYLIPFKNDPSSICLAFKFPDVNLDP